MLKKLQKRQREASSSRKKGTVLAAIVVGASIFGGTLHYQFSTTRNVSTQLKASSIPDQTIKEETPPSISTISGFLYTGYKPAPAEAYLLEHTKELGLANPVPQLAPTCHIWKDNSSTPYYNQLHSYLNELDAYNEKVENFQLPTDLDGDLRKHLTPTNQKTICNKVKLHPDGLLGIFNQSQQLSYTASGWAEPLMAPMRHPRFCFEGHRTLLRMDYMVHDFHGLCHKLKPTSRTILLDLGASLDREARNGKPPLIFLLDLYKKFGIKFDHIYAYEMKPKLAEQVFAKVPREYQAAFHWINVGVSADEASSMNPFTMIAETYNEDDLVIVKLDIDTPSIDLPLARQLLSNPLLAKLIDHFYFEHHVNQQEMAGYWGRHGITETVAESMEFFQNIRKLGIVSHNWI